MVDDLNLVQEPQPSSLNVFRKEHDEAIGATRDFPSIIGIGHGRQRIARDDGRCSPNESHASNFSEKILPCASISTALSTWLVLIMAHAAATTAPAVEITVPIVAIFDVDDGDVMSVTMIWPPPGAALLNGLGLLRKGIVSMDILRVTPLKIEGEMSQMT